MDKIIRRARAWRVTALLTALVLLAACDSAAQTPTGTPRATSDGVQASGKINVIATTTQIRSITESVAGDLANVRSILTPGADAHTFEPRPSDVQAIEQSNLVLKNGLKLDDWVDKIITNAGGQRPLVTVSTGAHVRKGDEEEPAGDPHIWFDVTNAMTMTRNIRDALIQVDPGNSGTY